MMLTILGWAGVAVAVGVALVCLILLAAAIRCLFEMWFL